jgi:hypothetical protein
MLIYADRENIARFLHSEMYDSTPEQSFDLDATAWDMADRLIDSFRAKRWAMLPGRVVTFDGLPSFEVHGLEDRRGLSYIPAELDELTHEIVAALNDRAVDGSRVAR